MNFRLSILHYHSEVVVLDLKGKASVELPQPSSCMKVCGTK